MRLLSGLLLASTTFLPCLVLATPTFNSYPATAYQGKNHPVVLNHETRLYKTLMTELSQQPVNFAGHYGIETYGCGGGCVAGLLYNAKTGATAYLPDSFKDCYSEENGFVSRDLEFQVNSRLLIGTGSRTGNQEQCEQVFYLMENGSLKELESHKIYPSRQSSIKSVIDALE